MCPAPAWSRGHAPATHEETTISSGPFHHTARGVLTRALPLKETPSHMQRMTRGYLTWAACCCWQYRERAPPWLVCTAVPPHGSTGLARTRAPLCMCGPPQVSILIGGTSERVSKQPHPVLPVGSGALGNAMRHTCAHMRRMCASCTGPSAPHANLCLPYSLDTHRRYMHGHTQAIHLGDAWSPNRLCRG